MTTVVLLGAGASVDAGLPAANSLSDKMSSWLRHHIDPTCGGPLDVQRADSFDQLVEAAREHDRVQGLHTEAIDVERIFALAQVLSERDSPILAPVVQEWKMLPDDTDGNVAQKLMRDMELALRDLLAPSHPSRFDYLQVLFSSNEPRIATLNMDCGVEIAAQRASVLLDLGLDNWRGGADWHWSHGDAQLLKLHGSIDRYLETGRELDGPGNRSTPGFPQMPEWDDEGLFEPGVIFGPRGKFRPDGPYLAMWLEFRRWLRSASRLIVCGYSFRDEHINHLIEEWSCNRHGLEIVVVDPGFPPEPSPRESHEFVPSDVWDTTEPFSPWHLMMLEYLACQGRPAWCPSFPSRWLDSQPKIEIIRQGAAAALPRALGITPLL
ncbi:SIR2 family protein [Luteococcus sediminum]